MRQTPCSSSFTRYSHSHAFSSSTLDNSPSSSYTSIKTSFLTPTSQASQRSLPTTPSSQSTSQQKSKKHSPGVYCYLSDSDEEENEIRKSPQNTSVPQGPPSDSDGPDFISKRSRFTKEETETENLPYLPSSLSDILEAAGNFEYVTENKEYNALDYHIHDISQQISSIQLHKDSELSIVYDLRSKICQKEVEFLAKMESFTSMRKRKMKSDHMNELENISEIENQIQKSLVDEEKANYFSQLEKIGNSKSTLPLDLDHLVQLLSKFGVVIGEKPKVSQSSYDLSPLEDKKLKEYEKFAHSCQKLITKLNEMNQQLQRSLEEGFDSQAQALAQQLTSYYLQDSLAQRLRNGKNKTLLFSDSLVKQVKSSSAESVKTTKSLSPQSVNPKPRVLPQSIPSPSVNSKEGVDLLLTDGTDDDSLVEEKISLDTWIRKLIEEYDAVIPALSSDEPLFCLLQDSLKRIAEMFMLPDDKRTTARLTSDISYIEDSLKNVSGLAAPSPSITALQCCLLVIYCYLIECAIRLDSEEKLLFFGHLSGAICRACGKTGGKILYAYLCACSMTNPQSSNDFNLEDPDIHTPLNVPAITSPQQRKRLILFYATQMGSAAAPARVDISSAWSWLIRCGITLSRYIHDKNQDLLSELCSWLRGYLRFIGTDLQLTYGGKFISLIDVVSTTLSSYSQSSGSVSSEISDLRTLLSDFSRSGILPCVLFKQKDSYSIYASSVIRYSIDLLHDNDRSLMKLKKISDEFDADRSEEMVKLKKYLEVAALASAFNILGPDPESHQRSIDMLTTHIARASSCENGNYLSYVLYKISKECLDFCQTPQWSVENAEPLATVICQLCTTFPNLSELYRMQFYKYCPMTIPLLSVEGDGDAMMLSLGFIGKKGKDGKIIWEQSSKWLTRMNKIIGTFASVIIYDSQNPLSLSDGWLWLSKVVNYCVRIPTEPAPHTAKLLDTFLRIVSTKMLMVYGPHYLAVIQTITDKVYPKLTENNSFVQAHAHKLQLHDFLSTYLSSQGQTSLPVLAEM